MQDVDTVDPGLSTQSLEGFAHSFLLETWRRNHPSICKPRTDTKRCERRMQIAHEHPTAVNVAEHSVNTPELMIFSMTMNQSCGPDGLGRDTRRCNSVLIEQSANES